MGARGRGRRIAWAGATANNTWAEQDGGNSRRRKWLGFELRSPVRMVQKPNPRHLSERGAKAGGGGGGWGAPSVSVYHGSSQEEAGFSRFGEAAQIVGETPGRSGRPMGQERMASLARRKAFSGGYTGGSGPE